MEFTYDVHQCDTFPQLMYNFSNIALFIFMLNFLSVRFSSVYSYCSKPMQTNLFFLHFPLQGPYDCWYYVFITTAAIYIFCGTVFMLLGSGELQPWNQPQFKELPVTEDSSHPHRVSEQLPLQG